MIYPRFFTFHCHLPQVRFSFASNPLLNRSLEWEANGICIGFATDLHRICNGFAWEMQIGEGKMDFLCYSVFLVRKIW